MSGYAALSLVMVLRMVGGLRQQSLGERLYQGTSQGAA